MSRQEDTHIKKPCLKRRRTDDTEEDGVMVKKTRPPPDLATLPPPTQEEEAEYELELRKLQLKKQREDNLVQKCKEFNAKLEEELNAEVTSMLEKMKIYVHEFFDSLENGQHQPSQLHQNPEEEEEFAKNDEDEK